jgi:hypothetical protein
MMAIKAGESIMNKPAHFRANQQTSSGSIFHHLGDDIEKWKVIIHQFENLPAPVKKEFLERLNGLAEKALDEETRGSVSDALRQVVSRHRQFASAAWALPDADIAQLVKVRDRFEPSDLVRRHAWLFGPRWQTAEKLEGQEERVEELRRSGLREILDQEGWPGVRKLMEAAEAPEEVGAVLAEIGFADSEVSILPVLLLSAGEKAARFAGGYVSKSFQKEGWDWVNRLQMNGWSTEEIARFLMVLPFERRTWTFAMEKSDEVATVYWRHAWPYTRGEDGKEATFAAEMLIKHGRASAAFIVLQMALHQRAIIQPDLLMDALEAWIKSETRAVEAHQGTRFQIQLLVQELQRRAAEKDQSVDLDRLATLEWGYLGLLDGHPASPVTLHRRLRDDPEFFVDVLGLVFRPKNQAVEDGKVLSEEESQRVQNAYRLLRSWQDVPGGGGGQTVDETTLYAWVQNARSLAGDRGLLEICDSRIGEVLAYSPEEADGSWPCVAVRDTLEEIGTDEVFQGLAVGIYNERGIVSRTMREGGAQERILAEKYRKFADASKIEWSKTAATLRRIADSYDEDARREDAQAALD